MPTINARRIGITIVACAMPLASYAQLPAGNAAGVATGHIHLVVPDVARHRAIWEDFGAERTTSGSLELLRFPGMFVLLREAQASGPSNGSTANHIGFLIRDFSAYKSKLQAHGADIVLENVEEGLLLADLPDGVRVEFRRDTTIDRPIEFHHVHLATPDSAEIRDWYVEVFGAEVSSRRNMPSALLPGGRVDFMAADGESTPTQGRAIDHIGFEIDDMSAFAAKLRGMGIAFDREPAEIPAIGLTIAFITDPAGTTIELTQGLRGK